MAAWLRITLTVAVLAIPRATWAADAPTLDYDRDVRPILSENCFQCHGQDGKKRMAGLRLDSFEGATADRQGHAALVSGRPDASAIYQRITAEQKSMRMPPVASNRNLTTEQIAMLKRWIAEGGKYTKHWAFVSPVRPAIPKTAGRGSVKQPIDAFVFQRLQAEGLKPSPAAAPGVWLHRLLYGAPPGTFGTIRISSRTDSSLPVISQ